MFAKRLKILGYEEEGRALLQPLLDQSVPQGWDRHWDGGSHFSAVQMDLDLKIFRLHRLGIPQERIVKGLGIPQQTISRHLPKMPELAKWVNSDLKRGFTVPQVAEKHKWKEPMVWFVALESKDDIERFKEVKRRF